MNLENGIEGTKKTKLNTSYERLKRIENVRKIAYTICIGSNFFINVQFPHPNYVIIIMI